MLRCGRGAGGCFKIAARCLIGHRQGQQQQQRPESSTTAGQEAAGALHIWCTRLRQFEKRRGSNSPSTPPPTANRQAHHAGNSTSYGKLVR